MNRSDTFEISPGGLFHGALRVPGDKSISHRAIMLGAIAEGHTRISGFLEGEDTLATLAAFRAMGVTIERDADRVSIDGAGLHGLRPPVAPLDLGNSGTSMRLLAGLLAGQRFDTTLTGDASLSRRPMRRVTEPLARMGAWIDTTAAGTAPLHIHGGRALTGIEYASPVASAQVKSCLLLAGLYAGGATRISEPMPSRDHTERMLEAFGCPVSSEAATVTVHGGPTLSACDIDVPADISSAAFFMVGASICPGSDLTLRHVGVNPTRAGVITVLRAMGADIAVLNERRQGGEPVADLRVRYAPLHGVAIGPEVVPAAIDEFPAIFIAAACAEGVTTLGGAEELRVKESDRIATMAGNLRLLGIDATALPDGMVITGGRLGAGTVDAHDDHRIAMSFAVAGARALGPVRVLHCANVATSFPGFVELARTAGLGIRGT
ncbi:MAG: 3-phosphoshikimate 1-carboxyvinyltransferase [Gammaproteobacteria bacterium]|nr:3-phosphoshikimate 1-carboxyvinyltransferase [Gammaproteobacteria bacterium]